MPGDDDLGSVSSLALPLPDAVVRYAAHDDGLVDVHLPLPGARPAPLVVLLHGGFWKQAYDRTHTRAAAAALAAEGYVVATPEYRRVGGAGGWPTTAQDVEDAVKAVPGLLAGMGLTTSGMTVAGHSAGGHLALWLANQAAGIDRVVGLAPVGDLRAAARERLGDAATQALLGGEPDEQPGRYDEADPLTRLQTSPPCEVVVVHGSADDVVPLSNSRGLAAAHPFVDLRVVEGADHFDVMNPTSAAWPVVLESLRRGG
ncbi:MAG TPA: alpha/beta hydrolase [Nocardioidaceae bacterium]|nr:alpha/beta hydrolase [Nocardioidaceae bacterium]